MVQELLDLCEETLKILDSLKQRGEITEDEYDLHKKLKLEFIKDHSKHSVETKSV